METKAGKPATSSSVKEPKQAERSKKSVPRAKPTHPPVAKMVNKAIKVLNDKKGSSVKAIKNYVAVNFMVDAEKLTPFIKNYLTKAVENKILLQCNGKGFTGSFKLAPVSTKSKDHVTASGPIKRVRKTKTSSSKANKPASKRQSRDAARQSVERKTSKTSTTSSKVGKNKA